MRAEKLNVRAAMLVCWSESLPTPLTPVQAEKLNGRAAMVGYAIAWFVDSLSGWGLVDQQNSFLGKFLLHIAVFAILIFRNLEAIPKYKVCPARLGC